MARRKRNLNFGSVSIGAEDKPAPIKPEDTLPTKEQAEELEKKIEEYRKDNPERPKDTTPMIQTPLSIKRDTGSFDSEYIDIAKKYLGMPDSKSPTLVDFAKSIIRLFEDNIKMYKMNHELSKNCKTNVGQMKHSWERGNEWN